LLVQNTLASLASLKSWLGITDASSDTSLQAWLTAASRSVLDMLDRGPTLAYRLVNEIRSGTGRPTLMLREWPVLSVTSLQVQGSAIQQQISAPFGQGWVLEPWNGDDTYGHQQIYTYGYIFPQGPTFNVMVSYYAGYYISDEPWTIPSVASPAVTTARLWNVDHGVTYANGTALTPVSTNTPAQGQYYVDPASGIYYFSNADEGQNIEISYSYTPEALSQAVVQLAAWNWRTKDRIGLVSKTLGGQETMTYSQKDMDALTTALLQPYMNTVPL
jgi:hypothetical protein